MTYREIYKLIRDAKKARNVDLCQLSAILGLTYRTLWYYNRGTKVPSQRTIEKLKEIVG